jgi:hypothetical protein
LFSFSLREKEGMRGILIQTLEMVDPLSLASVPAQGARESRAPARRGKGPLDLFLFPPHPGERGDLIRDFLMNLASHVNLRAAALKDCEVKLVTQLQTSMGSWLSHRSDEHNEFIILRNVPTRTEMLL